MGQLGLFSQDEMSELVPARELGPIVDVLEKCIEPDTFYRSNNIWFSVWLVARDERIVLECQDVEVIQRLIEWAKKIEVSPEEGHNIQENLDAIRGQLAQWGKAHV